MKLTRRRIIEAVVELSADPEAGSITVAAVSQRCEVSPATIYRYFPNRDALISAAANDRIATWTRERNEDLGGREYFEELWGDLARNLTLARQATVTEAGRELRSARHRAFTPVLDQAVRRAGKDPEDPDIRRALAAVNLLLSAQAFLDFHDRQGLTVEQAVDVAMWARQALLDSVGLDLSVIEAAPDARREP